MIIFIFFHNYFLRMMFLHHPFLFLIFTIKIELKRLLDINNNFKRK